MITLELRNWVSLIKMFVFHVCLIAVPEDFKNACVNMHFYLKQLPDSEPKEYADNQLYVPNGALELILKHFITLEVKTRFNPYCVF